MSKKIVNRGIKLSPLAGGWLHRKGLDRSSTNPFYAASFVCAVACRRLDKGKEQGVEAVTYLTRIGLLPYLLNLKPQSDQFDFDGMMSNTVKVAKFIAEMYSDDKVYLQTIKLCAAFMMRR